MEETIVDIINEYIIFYKNNYNGNISSFFDDIDEIDYSSTNIIMEEFYEIKNLFEKYEHENPIMNGIYKGNIDFESDNLYSITKNNEMYVISPSLFALLIEIINLKNEYIDDFFNIIILKQTHK